MSRYSPFFRHTQAITATIAAAVAFMISGCQNLPTLPDASHTANTPLQTTPRPTTTPEVLERRYQPQILINGRIAVNYQLNDQERNLPGSFEWEQYQDHLRISLYSPLGQTLALITEDKNGATLTQEGRQPAFASDLDQLLSDTLGWPLPVAGLRHWLQGYLRQHDGQLQGLITGDQTLTTEGWKLRYASWYNAPDFPKRLDLQRHTNEAGNVSIRIVIDQWKPL
ncbi:lipoprotein insertase outer membrane protein LolB [Undibacterium sp. SXout7W]|uniref:lipoprotein insertase outer membrane protein LolB n=1 Tax=Undibacterium sp. SXout7W TaxID=3413049 RepID=UPI003BF3AB0F